MNIIQLEDFNLSAKERQLKHLADGEQKDLYLKHLADSPDIRAVTVAFTDLEGAFHTLDYDKKFFLKSYDNLTFDGSSVRGFSVVKESDLRLQVDWSSFRALPPDVFGPAKMLCFALIKDRKDETYESD